MNAIQQAAAETQTTMNAATKYSKTTQHMMAQDYWLQVMNVGQRFEVMQAVGGYRSGEGERKYLHRCLDHLVTIKWEEILAHQATMPTI